jgi:hypothetical protein
MQFKLKRSDLRLWLDITSFDKSDFYKILSIYQSSVIFGLLTICNKANFIYLSICPILYYHKVIYNYLIFDKIYGNSVIIFM